MKYCIFSNWKKKRNKTSKTHVPQPAQLVQFLFKVCRAVSTFTKFKSGSFQLILDFAELLLASLVSNFNRRIMIVEAEALRSVFLNDKTIQLILTWIGTVYQCSVIQWQCFIIPFRGKGLRSVPSISSSVSVLTESLVSSEWDLNGLLTAGVLRHLFTSAGRKRFDWEVKERRTALWRLSVCLTCLSAHRQTDRRGSDSGFRSGL